MSSSNQKAVNLFFTRGKHKDSEVFYLSQSYFDLPKRTIRNTIIIKILFWRPLIDVKTYIELLLVFLRVIGEFKELCREALKDGQYRYFCFDRSKKKFRMNIVFVITEGRYVYRMYSRYKPFLKSYQPQVGSLFWSGMWK